MYEHVMAEMTQLRAAIEKSGRPFMYAEDWVHAPALAQDRRNPQATGDKILSMKAVVDDRRTFAHSHGMPLAAVLYLNRVGARARGESIGVCEVTCDVGNVAACLSASGRPFIKANPVDVED